MLIAVTFQVPTSAEATFKIPTYPTIYLRTVRLKETEFSESYITAAISPVLILPE